MGAGRGGGGEHLPLALKQIRCVAAASARNQSFLSGLRGDISSVAHPVATHDALQRVTKLLQNQGSENLLPAE